MFKAAVEPPIKFVLTPHPCAALTITVGKDGAVTTSTTTDEAYERYKRAIADGAYGGL